jgi:hypothetical protein
MTTVAYRSGILAADSRSTTHTDAGGARVFLSEKLFRKSILVNGVQQEVILATAGETFSGLVFVDWLGSGKEAPENLIHGDAEFTVLVLQNDGLWEFDKWCRGEKVLNEFYAVGSGAKAAMGAMHMGASAKRAVEVACLIDPYTAPPVVTMTLRKAKARKSAKIEHGKQAETAKTDQSARVSGSDARKGSSTDEGSAHGDLS